MIDQCEYTSSSIMSNKNQQKKKQGQQQQAPPKKQDNKSTKKQKKPQSKSGSCLPWLFGSFLIFGAISAVLIYDTNTKGSFEKSTVGKLLKDAGALPHVEKAYVVTLKYSARGYQWAATNAPVYYNATSTVLAPYLEVTKDLGKIALNGGKNAWGATLAYLDSKLPIVVAFIEQYAPGLPKTVSNVVSNGWTNLKNITIKTYKLAVEFFKTKVFVGTLSPENLGKLLNNTQQSMTLYCDRFHKNVDYYAKLK